MLVIVRGEDTGRRQGVNTKLLKEIGIANETLTKLNVQVRYATFGAMEIDEQVTAVARSRVLVAACGAGLSNVIFGLPGRMKVIQLDTKLEETDWGPAEPLFKTMSSKVGLPYFQEMYTENTAHNITREIVTFLRDVHGRSDLDGWPKIMEQRRE